MNCPGKLNSRVFSCLLLLFFSQHAAAQSSLMVKNGRITFFSSTPVEDIKAASGELSAVWLAKSQEVAFRVPVRSFRFAKGLMQEHFNENYMESDKYPYATFKGRVLPEIDLSRDGNYTVRASGVLTVHGVPRQREIPGEIVVQNGRMRITTGFDVACADHRIKIPTLIITKVAEVIHVKVDATLSPLNTEP